MSYKNPNIQEIIDNSTRYRHLVDKLSRNAIQSAMGNFRHKYGRQATLDDAEEIMRIFAHQYYDYYIIRPKMEKCWRKALSPIYTTLIYKHNLRVDIYSAACRFIEVMFCMDSFVETPDRTDYWYNPLVGKKGYFNTSLGNYLEDKKYKNPLRYIYKQKLQEDFIQWVINNQNHLDKHRPNSFVDFSHLAYNGVTDDF